MNLIFLGPPGAGKGTIAAKAVEILGIPHISTGLIFREAMNAGSTLGLKVKAIVESGALVDDATTIELVKERLAKSDAAKGFILDGFPRTLAQAEALGQFSKIDKAVNFDLPDSKVLMRLGGRRVCRKCGHNFHIMYDKPKVDGVCDHCGGEVYTRDDDSSKVITNRLLVYREQTAPLIGFYREKGLLADVDASPAVDEVVENFKKSVGL